MLNNPIGVFLYLILRNDVSWKLLSDDEKNIIKKANFTHNNFRDDYASPERYGLGRKELGENWDTFNKNEINEKEDIKFIILNNALKKNPISVLEIGPGSGYYSKMIFNHPSILNYDFIDINNKFLEFIAERIANSNKANNFSSNTFVGDASSFDFQGKKYDLIVCLSSIHHIPDRQDLIQSITNNLSKNGVLIAVDPTHYLKRIILLIYKMITRGYLKKKYYMNREGLSTHHMCTLGEYKKIIRNNSNIEIESVIFNRNELINIAPFKKYLSSYIAIMLKKL